ncbi:hypothetical protein H102_07940 [Trichophyton rubrum CBS 100081]|nr:hypothetical protein H100_07980 [Trichophyton rubrum MR850]EZF37630.1 hypothetical protein H102_07940 [Trichophyton rubrum CBS 100081]
MSCLGYPGLSNAKGALSAESAIDHRANGYALHLCLPCQRAHQCSAFFTGPFRFKGSKVLTRLAFRRYIRRLTSMEPPTIALLSSG